jgi:hypothetical protein
MSNAKLLAVSENLSNEDIKAYNAYIASYVNYKNESPFYGTTKALCMSDEIKESYNEPHHYVIEVARQRVQECIGTNVRYRTLLISIDMLNIRHEDNSIIIDLSEYASIGFLVFEEMCIYYDHTGSHFEYSLEYNGVQQNIQENFNGFDYIGVYDHRPKEPRKLLGLSGENSLIMKITDVHKRSNIDSDKIRRSWIRFGIMV